MRYLAPAFLALALFAPAAQAASFDCAQASTEIERMICGDAELSQLDETLGDRYVRALAKGEDAAALKADQRAWLRETRAACTDAACMKTAYAARITELTKIGWMTDDKARAICEEVVAGVNDGSLQERFIKFDRTTEEDRRAAAIAVPYLSRGFGGILRTDYDNDGKAEILGQFDGGGSCIAGEVTDLAIGSREEGGANAPNWGYYAEFLTIAGEPIIVEAHSGNAPRVTRVSWLRPDGEMLPLCYLGSASKMRVRTIKEDNPALCQAVIDGNVEFVQWSPTSISPDRLRELGVLPSSEAFEAFLDIDLDGQSNAVLRLGYDSGAGCGGYFEDFREIDSKTGSANDSPINHFLRQDRWGPMSRFEKPEQWFSPTFFHFEGKPYLLGKRSLMRMPQVISLWENEAHTWCELELLPQHRVVEFYAVETRLR